MRNLSIGLLIVAAAAGVTVLSAFQNQKTQDTNSTKQHAATSKDNDAVLAEWLLISSNNGLALAQLGQQRAQDPEVKQFASKVVAEHQQCQQKLQPYAPGVAATGNEVEASSARAQTQGFDHASLFRELGDQSLSSVRSELEQKQGAEFDHCYMAMSIGCHMMANDMLTVFQRHASGEFKSVLAEGQRTVAANLAEAKTIAKRLEGKSRTTAVSNSGK